MSADATPERITTTQHKSPRNPGALGRTAVLLGAGASADAGLPLTVELASRIVARVNASNSSAEWVRTLNFIYGSMVSHQTRDGGNPLAAVNIERLISSVRLLRDRNSHEVAPFVGSWKPGSGGITSGRDAFRFERSFTSAVDESLINGSKGSGIYDLIISAVRAQLDPDDPRVFEEIETHLLLELKQELSATIDVRYLDPLADLAASQPGGVDVITLNYDTSVEQMAAEYGREITVDTGIQRWKPGRELRFVRRDNKLNLYKIHGSLDWHVNQTRNRDLAIHAISISQGSSTDQKLPWLVVGDREKLGTEGPTLTLLRAAETALSRADHLVVVGYSFGDAHVNAMIRDWMLADSVRSIGVLDYLLPTDAGTLLSIIREYNGVTIVEDGVGAVNPRFVGFRGTTKEHLRSALSVRPVPDPEPMITMRIAEQEGEIIATATNHGPDLRDCEIWPLGVDKSPANHLVFWDLEKLNEWRALSGQPQGTGGRAPGSRVFDLHSGASVTFFIMLNGDDKEVNFTITGAALTGHRSRRIRVPLPSE